MLVGVRRRRRPRRHLQLAEDVLQVTSDGVLADDQRGRDLAVALATATRRSTSRSRSVRTARPAARPRPASSTRRRSVRAPNRSNVARAAPSSRRAVSSSPRARQHARWRRGSGPPRTASRRGARCRGPARSTSRAGDGCPSASRIVPRRVSGDRVEQRGADRGGDALELAGRGVGRDPILRRHHDLHRRGEHRRPTQRLASLVEHPADGRRGEGRRGPRPDAAERDPAPARTHRRARPDTPARLRRDGRGGGGAHPTGTAPSRALDAPAARGAPRAVGLDHRLGPRAVRLQHLRSMDEALAPVRHQPGLRGAPLAQRLGPLRGPAEIERLHALGNDRAVDDPGRDGRHLTSRDGDHRLVEEAHAGGDLAERHGDLTLAQDAQRDQIGVGEPVTDRHALVGEAPRFVDVATAERMQEVGDAEVPTRGAVDGRRHRGAGRPVPAIRWRGRCRHGASTRYPATPRTGRPCRRRRRPRAGGTPPPTPARSRRPDRAGGRTRPRAPGRRPADLRLRGAGRTPHPTPGGRRPRVPGRPVRSPPSLVASGGDVGGRQGGVT